MKQNGISHNLTGNDAAINPGDKFFNMEHRATDKKASSRENIESLFEMTGDYLETRIDLLKLKAVDRSSDVIASLISKLIVLCSLTIFVVLINIGLALLLGELMGRAYYGFFVVGGFYLIAGVIFYTMRRKWFKEPIADNIIKKLMK
jgi:hypothetical protein